MKTTMRLALTSLAVLALAGCGDRADKTGAGPTAAGAPAQSNGTLTETLKAGGAYRALAQVSENSGLAAALEGVGPYTVFAPAEPALKPDGGPDFTDPAMKTEGAALLRAHIVPGALTRADIAAAVDRSGGQGAQVMTMAGNLLTFTRSGDTLVATAAGGSAVRLTGQEVIASNGVVQPIDGLLIKPEPATN